MTNSQPTFYMDGANSSIKPSSGSQAVATKQDPNQFVTEVMHRASPVFGFHKMEQVIADLTDAKQTAVPVVSEMGCCTGILTQSDVAKYLELKKRFEDGDQSVIDQIFEADDYGQRRASCRDFDLVRRQMTSPVVTVSQQQTVGQAYSLFDANPNIHHLVVVDERDHPVGILELADVSQQM